MRRPEGFDGPLPERRPRAGGHEPSAHESASADELSATRAAGETGVVRGDDARATGPIVEQDAVVAVRSHAERTARALRVAERRDAQSAKRARREAEREAALAARARRKLETREVRRFTGARRRRRWQIVIALGVAVAVFFGLVGLVHSPLFAVDRVEVVGTERLDPAAIEAALASTIGEPLAAVTAESVRDELAGFTLIRSYTVDASPPGTVIVRIVERQPILSVQSDAGVVLVDPAGVQIEVVDAAPEGLPLLQDVEVGSAGFSACVDVVLALPSAVRPLVVTIAATAIDDVQFTLTTGQYVVWGSAEESSLKGDVLLALLWSAGSSAGQTIDVSAPEHPVVR